MVAIWPLARAVWFLKWNPTSIRTEFVSFLDPGLLTNKVNDEAKGSVNLPLCILWLSWAFTSPFLSWCHGRTWRTSETMVAVRLVHVSIPRPAALVLQRWSLALLVGGRADRWPGLTCASKASVCERIRHRCKTGAFPVADKNLQYCGEPPCEV